MKVKLNSEEWIDETMNSLTPSEMQEPPAYLLTRLHAKFKQEEEPGLLTKLILFLSRPAMVMSILFFVLVVNALIIASNIKAQQSSPVSVNTHYREDFASSLVSVYDYEYSEP